MPRSIFIQKICKTSTIVLLKPAHLNYKNLGYSYFTLRQQFNYQSCIRFGFNFNEFDSVLLNYSCNFKQFKMICREVKGHDQIVHCKVEKETGGNKKERKEDQREKCRMYG